MNWCLLIPIIVGVICAILGYLLGRLLAGNNNAEVEAWQKKYDKLSADLADCKSKLAVKADASVATNLASTEHTTLHLIPFDAVLAKTTYGKKIKQDDLKIIEGIGPKIEILFHNHGIKTWKALAESSVEKCLEVLQSGGKAYEIHKPDTWPRQAQLAYEGKWVALKAWQDELKGGKES
ncbi:hypothetical protein [Joostella sp. CR20]|uniref:hypothetical protein n=1 Tax=Joostella sp. CR20 TaxID=2804312 RepID=UPI00313A9389